jgi:16S rRNA (cytosine1402-N4)-methyltransferase
MKDGPLDMRMGKTGLTAADICNVLDFAELRRILTVYGDEPRAKSIATSIIENRPLHTTQDLHKAVAAVTPQFVRKGKRMGRTATLARVFQSLRILVNQEDVVLERALTQMAPSILRPGGRLAVLSYHSLEDRAVKRTIRDGTISKREAEERKRERDMYGNYIGPPKPFRSVGKPQKATEREIEINVRARSATLRVAERTDS